MASENSSGSKFSPSGHEQPSSTIENGGQIKNGSTNSPSKDLRASIRLQLDDISKSPEDKRSYRGILFQNGLKAILVSDPTTDLSAASLAVRIGSMSDPREFPGLAHFLEHMLFLGTEKYPEENAYHKFIHEHGGSSNAFTSSEFTNFHFDCSPASLAPALDHFAQFFIAPLFTESATEREVNAVHSEHQKNIQMDQWRLYQLSKWLSSQKHDYSKFGTGSRETLWPASGAARLREELLAFHSRWYSANLMGLCVLGSESLDRLTQLVVDLFAPVRNLNAPIREWRDHPLTDEHLKAAIKVVPIKDLRELVIVWPIPDQQPFYKSKPSHYLSHLLGHEGRGSLLAELKRRGWANTIVAGEQDGARGFSTFHMAVDLTEAGLANAERVVELAFRYLAMLREAGPRREVYDELRDLSALRFRFKDKQNPVSYATHLSSALHYYPLKEVLAADFLLEQYDPTQIETLLVYLTPDNCRYMVVSQDFAGKTDQKERWYGTEYSKTPFSPSVLENLRASSPESSLHLPAPNPFIPKRLELLEREPDNVQLPRLLIDSNTTRLWYKQDNHYLLPKAMTMLEIVSPVPYSSPHTVNCLNLSLSLISDHLNEYTYDAELAGLNFSLDSSHHGLALKVGGYNDKLPVLLDKLLETILSFKINPERFAILREVYERSLKNQAANEPYTHALYYSTFALSEVQWSFEEKLAVFDELTQPALEAFLKDFLGHLFVECLFYGNFTKLTSQELVDGVRKRLTNAGTRTLLPQQMRRFREVQVPNDGVSYVYHRKNKVHPSNSIDMLLQVGPERLEDSVRLNLLAHLFSEPFFNKLRTDEQLGYIVHCSERRSHGCLYLRFLVQSERSLEHVERRIEAFVASAHAMLRGMSPEEFERNKQAVIQLLRVKPKKLSGQAEHFWAEIVSQDYNFDRREIEAKGTEALSKEDILAFFEKYVAIGAPLRRKFVTEIEGIEKSAEKSASPPEDQHVEEVSVSAQVNLHEASPMAVSVETVASTSSRGESATATNEDADTTRHNSISSPNQTFVTPDTASPRSPSPNDIDALIDKAVSKRERLEDLQLWKRSQPLWPLPRSHIVVPSRAYFKDSEV